MEERKLQHRNNWHINSIKLHENSNQFLFTFLKVKLVFHFPWQNIMQHAPSEWHLQRCTLADSDVTLQQTFQALGTWKAVVNQSALPSHVQQVPALPDLFGLSWAVGKPRVPEMPPVYVTSDTLTKTKWEIPPTPFCKRVYMPGRGLLKLIKVFYRNWE